MGLRGVFSGLRKSDFSSTTDLLVESKKSPTEFNQSGWTVTTGGWQSLVPSARE
jgi:hypothetical protein